MAGRTTIETTSPQRPVAVVVSVIIAVATGVMMAWSRHTALATRGTAEDHALALCLLIAGSAGVAGGIGAWKRASWSSGAFAVWIAGTLVAILLQDVIDAGTLIPILIFCGPQVLIAWYLVTWMRGAEEPVAFSSNQTRDNAWSTPALLTVGVLGPPIMTIAGFFLIAALPGNPVSAALLLMPIVLLVSVVALARRAVSKSVAVIFTALAATTSALALLVMTLGSMVK